MREITVTKSFTASRHDAWEVLADFPAISAWNSGVKTSFSTGDAHNGVGATRHCDLAPMGTLEETIAEWEPEQRMVIRIDSASKLPLSSALVTFEVGDAGEPTTITYAYEPRFGPIGDLMGPMLDKKMVAGFEGFLADWEAAAEKRAAV